MLMCAGANVRAQQFEYRDSSLLQNENNNIEVAPEPMYEEEETAADTIITLNPLQINPDSIKKWKDSKKYAYAKNLDSILKAYQDELLSKPNKKPAALSGAMRFLQPLLWTFAILFVLFILYRIFITQGAFKKRPAKVIAEPDTEEEALLNQNYDSLISQCQARADFRMATRYWFLKTLQRLSDHNLIHFAADKTNGAYVRELPADKQSPFAHLVLNYEFVWYGRRDIDAALYQRITEKFDHFYSKI